MKFKHLTIIGALMAMSLTACGGSSAGGNTKYVKSITIAASADSKTEEGFDMVLEVTQTGTIDYSYTPADATATFTWKSSNNDVATVSNSATKGKANVNPKAAGEIEVYVTAEGKDKAEIKSNTLKIKINANVKTNEDFDKAKTTYIDSKGQEQPLNMQTIFTNQNAPHLDPLTEQHVLVVPFGFTDSDLAENVQTQANIERIKTAFFGTPEEIQEHNGWVSMSQFYKTTSYGKSEFNGDVLPTWCVYNGTSQAFYNKYKSGNGLGINAAEYARNWYNTQYALENHGALGADAKPFTYYDCNNDGFLDLIWIVYSRPTGTTEDWWAYVTYTGNTSNKTNPTVKTLGFASVDWLDSAFNGYDPHTFIHETGHTYGLDDYYDYTNSWKPMGGVDFMDQNLGDHCMFSKFTLGWTSPWVVDDSAIITLRPGTTTGDCFIIPSPGYNGTAFDEYIMVELMAPVGLAEQDYKNGYLSTDGFSEPGLRITHVDARVYKGNHDSYCVDNPQEGIDFRVCNTKGGRIGVKADSDFVYIQNGDKQTKSYYTLTSLFESTINEENCMTSAHYNASNSSLFRKGHRFNLSSKNGWAKAFMPSQTNLWNKSKTITGWIGDEQQYEIDETCTFNYSLSVTNITTDPEYGYIAKVKVTANAY
ncbi:MAG: Ig-like domain-containing protein [Bacilli bacterium]|nr:Ig-like domain-containing protein [Bacilli bacterium]